MAHKKNQYEEQLHKSEEERHEYDYHIEANLRTIALLEPLNNKIQTMDAEERTHFNLKAGLGGQSKSIYQRIIKKVYGKELGPEIIRALHDNPVIALPIVLERLKLKDEEWKKAQREWNRVWREQDAKNFYKALDHQGVQFKNTDKKVLQTKSLVGEIEARKREQTNHRLAMLDFTPWRARPQFEFVFTDVEVLKDVLKLVISYLDRVNNSLSTSDKSKIEDQLRGFVPLLFMFDKEEFDAEFGDGENGSPEGDERSDDSDGDVSMADEEEEKKVGMNGHANGTANGKKGPSAGDLRKKLLKQVREKGRGGRASTATPGPDERVRSVEGTPATDGGRAETPVPVAADPAAVAEAVEKDKAVAEASEQIWVQIDNPEGEGSSRAGSEEKIGSKKVPRRGSFFANTHYYILIRLVQVSRLSCIPEIY
jgi:paired amphipathic helix protein Sin3a